MSWQSVSAAMLDGLAWGVPPDRLLEILAGDGGHAPLSAVRQDVQAGRPLAEALAARGAPPELVEAARVGGTVDTPLAVGLRSRAAARGLASDRLEVLGGLLLPLLSLSAIGSAVGFAWLDSITDAQPPYWVAWTARSLSLVGLILAVSLIVPPVGRLMVRLPGLGWIGRPRRAARWADLLSVSLAHGGDPSATLEHLGARRVAQAVQSGTPLPDALQRHPDGRPVGRALAGLAPRSWATALSDTARRLAATADAQSARWGLRIRVGGTLIAAILATVWLVWIYGGLGGLPGTAVGG